MDGLWFWILLACAVAYATKLLGYLVPSRLLDNPRMLRGAGAVTIGLLASLTAVNTFAAGQAIVLDARIAALAAAGVALLLRAPFLVVVIVGAAAAAGTRLLGWG
ncbi:AzlD domain-containing protein [Zhihengliuella alba]|uniref:AzlD domain-containing protein n=1 Tax=Zhihengliuella alba TaxID=547018 RepID=A0ABP7DZE1_9MICC